MPDLIGHFDDLTDILINIHPQAGLLRERRIDERVGWPLTPCDRLQAARCRLTAQSLK